MNKITTKEFANALSESLTVEGGLADRIDLAVTDALVVLAENRNTGGMDPNRNRVVQVTLANGQLFRVTVARVL